MNRPNITAPARATCTGRTFFSGGSAREENLIDGQAPKTLHICVVGTGGGDLPWLVSLSAPRKNCYLRSILSSTMNFKLHFPKHIADVVFTPIHNSSKAYLPSPLG